MKTFDTNMLQAFLFTEREKNVFYRTAEFKMRMIGIQINKQPK